MATSNSSAIEIIPALEISTIHTDNEPSIHDEHFFDIQEGCEKNYDSYVIRELYKENTEKVGDQKTIVYNLMCEKAKI